MELEQNGTAVLDKAGKNRVIPATFEVIYFIGWKSHVSQPVPKRRGSSSFSLKELGDSETLSEEEVK